MSIYLISNREVLNEHNTERFAVKGKEKALPKFRVAKCTIKDNQKYADYEILNDQYPADYTDVVDAIDDPQKAKELSGTSSMFYDLYNQMITSKGKKSDVLVFIHGFANSFDDNLEHIATLYHTFMNVTNSPIKHLVFIAWPTRNHKVLTYWNDQKDAWETGRLLARVYEKLLDFFVEMFKKHSMENCRNKIHLAAHSMGNQVLASMLQNINKKIYPFFSEILLLHSDVEDNAFENDEPFSKLEKLAERTHVYIHKSDDALFISRFTKNFNKRLGKKGPLNYDSLNNETYVIDVSNLRTGENFKERLFDHWGYKESNTMVNDILEVLKGTDIEHIAKRKKIKNKLFRLEE
ncbi:MAG: alpha/beta hydrolase [Bacteroidales bacterium]|nr:alpha/beta hydrolase [Bacteroidales bacterium]